MAEVMSAVCCPKCGSSNTEALQNPNNYWTYCCECAYLWKKFVLSAVDARHHRRSWLTISRIA